MSSSEAAQPARRPAIPGLFDVVATTGDLQLAYSLFRITLGMNIFFHGAMRLITGLDAWATKQGAVFQNTLLPMWSVSAFLHVLPFVEVILGTLTFLGLYTRWALIAGSLMMLTLVFGNDIRQDWGTVGNNMHYVLYYAGLIAAYRYNAFALDNRRTR